MVPRIFGPYEPIRRDYPIEEYLADLAGTGVEKSVYVQTNWAKAGAVDEVAWVQATADAHGWPHAIVGYADLLDDAVGEVLERQAAFPLMRGVRMQLHWHENPQYRFAPTPDLMDDAGLPPQPAAPRGLRLVVRPAGLRRADGGRGAAGGGQSRHHLRAAALRHAGGPDPARPGRLARRHAPPRRPAERRQQALRPRHLHPPQRPRRTSPTSSARPSALFGPDRCLFGSNFPIEKLWTSYADLVAAFRQAVAAFPEPARRSMLAATAATVYRL